MIPCDNTTLQSELKAYLDGQLPFLMRQRVRRHLGHCAACREELSAMEQISNELRADGPQPLQSSLRDRILNAVSNTGGAPTASDTPLTPAPPRSKNRRPLLLWAGAATVFVAWFTLYPLLHGDALRPMMSSQARSREPNLKSVGTGSLLYLQDNDAVTALSSQPPVSASVPMPAPATVTAASPPPMPKMEAALAKARRSKSSAPALGYQPMDRSDANSQAFAGESQQRAVMGGRPVQQASGAKMMDTSRAARAAATPEGLDQVQEEVKVERQVHKEATFTVQVDNPEAKSETAAQIAQTAGGFVANNELTTGDDNTKTASLTLKVPVTQFEAVLSQLAHMGEVKAKNITGEDLTEKISDQQQAEHVLRQDIGATQEELTHRLSKSAREERMDSLRELRTRIAQTRARLQLLRKLGALSTITLELTEKPSPAPAPKVGGFMSDMNDTLHGAVQSMMQAARLPILTFIWILAYSPLWILLIVGYRYAVRR